MEKIWGDLICRRYLYGSYLNMNIMKYFVDCKTGIFQRFQIWQNVIKDFSRKLGI